MKTLCAVAIISSAVLLGAQGQPVMIEWTHTGSEQSSHAAALVAGALENDGT